MDYEIRITKGHIFELSRIIKKAGIKVPATDDPQVLGDVLTTLVQNVGTVEKEIDRFIANVCKIDLNIVKDMDAEEYVELVMYVFQSPNLKRVINKFTTMSQKNKNSNLASATTVMNSSN